VDIPNDGEFGKPMRSASDLAAWGTYIFNRISGFGPTSPDAAAPDRSLPGQPMRIVGVRWEQREFSEFYAESALGTPTTASRPTCIGPITYTGNDALHRDLANLKAATEAKGVRNRLRLGRPGSLADSLGKASGASRRCTPRKQKALGKLTAACQPEQFTGSEGGG
jgi:hypothetical protein